MALLDISVRIGDNQKEFVDQQIVIGARIERRIAFALWSYRQHLKSLPTTEAKCPTNRRKDIHRQSDPRAVDLQSAEGFALDLGY